MNTKKLALFIIVVILTLGSLFTAFIGVQVGDWSMGPLTEEINQGLDLQGGVYLVFEAQTASTGADLDREIQQVIEIFRRRVDSLGLTEPVIVREGDDRIRVELPGVEDAEDAIAMIGTTARLEFIGPDGEQVLTGENVRDARVEFQYNEPVVRLELNASGREAFSEITERLARLPETPREPRVIDILLDDEVISDPAVNSHITDGVAVITGNFTVESAAELAALIRGGALPVDLEQVRTSTITATLGEFALQRSVYAAIIGISILLVVMLVIYRIPGLVANIALLLYILLVFSIITLLNATVTLPGIAALILSVGMAVDANVIIFERIKEYVRDGKSVRAAIESGFKRAFTTIFDANVTTLIAGLVLYQFGTGTIRGFAVLLIIGILCSMFTALIITRLLLRLVVSIHPKKSKALFGAK